MPYRYWLVTDFRLLFIELETERIQVLVCQLLHLTIILQKKILSNVKRNGVICEYLREKLKKVDDLFINYRSLCLKDIKALNYNN